MAAFDEDQHVQQALTQRKHSLNLIIIAFSKVIVWMRLLETTSHNMQAKMLIW